MRNAINLQNLKKYFTLTQVFILVLVANVVSCNCNKNGDKQDQKTGKLSMEVAPLQLDPTNPTTTVTFQLTEPEKKADLATFHLKAHLTKQQGGTGKLKYQDAAGNPQEEIKLDVPLTHFTSLTSLENENAPLKIDFTVLADPAATLLVYQIEAFDADNNSIGSFDVTYQAKKNQELATLKLESKEQLEGDQKEIKLELHNPSSETLAAGTIKLQIKRTLGKNAIILGSMPTAAPDMYELAINEEILPTQSLHKTFLIDSQTDVKAAFEIQLIQGTKPGNTITVYWEKGVQLELAVEYEGSPRQLTYTIINSGTKEIKHAKLQYTCETAGIQLAGKALTKDEPQALPIGDLAVNKKIANQVLGAINFGSKTEANFVFKVIYDGGASEEKRIVCTAADVQLSIEGLTYDVATNQVSYSIRNAGQDKADGVQMRYTNERQDEAGKKVTIDNQTTATSAPLNISKTATTAPINLPIDFKQADEATFTFELLYKGIVISQTKRIQTFKAKEVKLELVPITNPTLTGGDQIFKCRMDLAADSRAITGIDPKQLRIQITNSTGNSSFISKAAGDGKGIDHLAGDELGNIGDEITLYINPHTEEQASFSFELSYKNIPQGKVLPISWQEENIQMQDLYAFVGNNEATFGLFSSVAEIDHSQLTIEISSNNTASFTLIKHDNSNGGTNLALDKLIGARKTGSNQKTAPIRFKLLDAKGEDHAEVTVHIKRGSKELARQTVTWKATGATLSIVSVSGYNKFGDGMLQLQIENKGAVVNTDKIRVKFINDRNVAFKVGQFSANTTTTTTLNNIINKAALKEGKSVKFDIQQDGTKIPDLYATDIQLEILDEGGIVLAGISLEWVNHTKMNAELEPLLQGLGKFEEDLKREIDKAENAKNYNTWKEAFKAIIQIKRYLDDHQSKLNNIDKNKISRFLQEVVTNRIQVIQQLIKKVHQEIIDLLQTEVDEERKVADEQVKEIIKKLADAAVPEDKEIGDLDNKVQFIKEIADNVTELANAYNTDASKKIAEEAKKIVEEIGAAAKKARDEATKKQADTAYIKQIEGAATIKEALQVADELYNTEASANNDLSKKALPAYMLVVQKAITKALPITIEQIDNVIQSITTISLTQIPEESKEKVAIALKDSIKLIKQNIEQDPTLDIKNIQDTIGGGSLTLTLGYIKSNTGESSEIYKQAVQAIAAIDQLAKQPKITPITQEMIDYAKNQQMQFVSKVLKGLKDSTVIDINEQNVSLIEKPTALWEVVTQATTKHRNENDKKQDKIIIRALLDRGADIGILCGNPPIAAISWAAQNLKIDMLTFLINEVISRNIKQALNVKYTNDQTILHIAVICGLGKEIVEKLINNGLDVNAQDQLGRTPLHYAVKQGANYEKIITLLLDKGAKTDISDNKNKKPVDYSRQKGLGQDIIERLRHA